MPAYRLCLWSREQDRLIERSLDARLARDEGVLLDSFERIGRDALRLTRDAAAITIGEPPTPGKLVRARRHLRAALRLLEETGEHIAAARTLSSIADLRRREEGFRRAG